MLTQNEIQYLSIAVTAMHDLGWSTSIIAEGRAAVSVNLHQGQPVYYSIKVDGIVENGDVSGIEDLKKALTTKRVPPVNGIPEFDAIWDNVPTDEAIMEFIDTQMPEGQRGFATRWGTLDLAEKICRLVHAKGCGKVPEPALAHNHAFGFATATLGPGTSFTSIPEVFTFVRALIGLVRAALPGVKTGAELPATKQVPARIQSLEKQVVVLAEDNTRHIKLTARALGALKTANHYLTWYQHHFEAADDELSKVAMVEIQNTLQDLDRLLYVK